MKIQFRLKFPFAKHFEGEWPRCWREIDDMDTALRLINENPYTYNFGNGWFALIEAAFLSDSGAFYIKNDHFHGYEWAIDSIIEYGEINVVAPPRIVGRRSCVTDRYLRPRTFDPRNASL